LIRPLENRKSVKSPVAAKTKTLILANGGSRVGRK
jgi:hypothetical protein